MLGMAGMVGIDIVGIDTVGSQPDICDLTPENNPPTFVGLQGEGGEDSLELYWQCTWCDVKVNVECIGKDKKMSSLEGFSFLPSLFFIHFKIKVPTTHYPCFSSFACKCP